MAPVKTGILGYGASTTIFHLPFILPNPDLDVIAFLQRKEAPQGETTIEPGVHCTVDYPKAKHYRQAEDLFADKDIELVIVCTSSESHAALAEKALLAGKHVVVEKPFTVTSAEADKLIALAKKQGKVLTCFQNRRYDSDFLTLQHLVKIGSFGQITEFENRYDMDNPPWIQKWSSPDLLPGEGMMYALGSHTIDQTLLLFGLPESVTAITRSLRRESKTEDAFTIVLQYGGEWKNLVCTIKTTIISPQPPHVRPRYYIRGTKGSFLKNGEDYQIDQHFAGMKATDPGFGVEPTRYHGHLFSSEPLDEKFEKPDASDVKFSGTIASKTGCYMDYYRDVVAAIKGEKEVVVKPEESRNGIRVIELARESAEKGVTIPWSNA